MKKAGLIIGSILLLLLIAFGVYYFLYIRKSDEKLLDNYDKQITAIEASVVKDEAIDQETIVEIDESTTEDEEALDNMESSLNSILNSLEKIENAEAGISEEVE
jgi:uncharacterized coiled-coil protein SlyX